MADVRPLRGVRFDPRQSGPVGPLIAPPYDVAAEPANGAEFSIRKIESVDLVGDGDSHALAAERYRKWLKQGALRQDAEPMIYIHHHQFSHNGVITSRRGLFARVRLTDWTERIVLPHERTTPGPRRERLDRLRAVHANLSPLYFLYRDPENQIRDLIAHQAGSGLSVDHHDQMGGTHSLTPIVETKLHARISNTFAQRTLFVADGHHRFEAALSFRNECRDRYGYDPDAPWEFVLALLAAVEDPGVIVRPTHRVLVSGQSISSASILELFHRWFDVRKTQLDGPMPGESFVCRVVLPDEFGVWDIQPKPGDPHHALLPGDRRGAWRSLGVAAVGSITESLFGVDSKMPEQRLLPAIDAVDAVDKVRSGRAQAAFLLPAPNLGRLLAVAEEGDLLPAKSTWFEPKAPAGLVITI